MLDAIVKQLEKTDNVERSTYIWNAVSATVLAMQSPIILAVMSRTNETSDAGIFSIAIAVANLMMYVGQYGLRRFQASDISEQFKFEEYHGMRILTCTMLILASAGYCVYSYHFKSYSPHKSCAIFLICMLKMIQAYSDVFHGNMQQKRRFDVAAKATSIRYTAEIVVFCLSLVITKNLLVSAVACVVSSVFLMMVLSMNACRHYCDSLEPSFNTSAIRGLFTEGFPLFISMFLNTYVGNAPKYAIDSYLTDDMQGLFGFLFMPAFVVQIVAQFIFNPVITSYAHMWTHHTIKSHVELEKRIRKMCLIVLGLSVLGLAVAATIGTPVLSVVFGVDLSGYKRELCIIMLGGGMLAYATYFSTIIAIIRIQRSLVVCYGVVSVISIVMSEFFVRSNGVFGASLLYVLLMGLLAVTLYIAMKKRFVEERKVLIAEQSGRLCKR